MKANVGDYLVVKGTTTERHDQHAEIIEVRSQDGSPPYVVRWLVTGHEATVYPGSDAVVVTARAYGGRTTHCRAGRARRHDPHSGSVRFVGPRVIRRESGCVGQHGQLTPGSEAAAQVEGTAASSSRLPDACGVARSKNRSSSTGKGSTRVEFFSAATSTTVSKSRN